MYTKGIRKIVDLDCLDLMTAKHMADQCDFEAFSFNGDVYVKVESPRVKRTWCRSPFRIDDFKVGFYD